MSEQEDRGFIAIEPKPTIHPDSQQVLPLVLNRLSKSERHLLEPELRRRANIGLQTYGVPLMTHNGRNALRDILDEVLDAMKYMTQHERERAESMIDDFHALKRIALRVKIRLDQQEKRQ